MTPIDVKLSRRDPRPFLSSDYAWLSPAVPSGTVAVLYGISHAPPMFQRRVVTAGDLIPLLPMGAEAEFFVVYRTGTAGPWSYAEAVVLDSPFPDDPPAAMSEYLGTIGFIDPDDPTEPIIHMV